MFRLGLPECIVIFLAVIILFGPKALPDIISAVTTAIRKFRKSIDDIGSDDDINGTKL